MKAKLFLLLIMGCKLFSQTYSGGSGTITDPYQISTKADLKYLCENVIEWNKNFKQTTDILFTVSDFSNGGDFYNNGKGFIPISLKGIYNGDYHTITGLTINDPSSSNIGMFGYLNGTDIQILNLGLINVNITGGTVVGSLVGDNINATITNCYSTGSVSSITSQGSFVGGLVGRNDFNGNITSCYTTCTVSSTTTSTSNVGGFTAYNRGTISKSYATGTINSSSISSEVGGFIGYCIDGVISDCYSTGNISSFVSNPSFTNICGAFIGRNDSGDISRCYAVGKPIASGGITYIGGFVGFLYNIGATFNYCYYDTNTTEQMFTYYDAINGMYSSNQISQVEGKSTSSMQTQSTFTNWDFTTIWQILGTAYPTFLTSNLSTTNFAENNSSFKIYPNPTTDYVEISTTEKIESLSLFDKTGKQIISDANPLNKVSLAKYASEIYLMKVIFENGNTSTKKIIKK